MKKILSIIFAINLSSLSAEEIQTGGGYDYKAAQQAEAAAFAKIKAAEKQKNIRAQKKLKEQKLANEKASLKPDKLAKLKDADLCVKAGKYRNKPDLNNIYQELNKRNTSYDPVSIKNNSVKINGFECDIFAAYGKPERYNRTVTQRGTSVQMVYGDTYIYTNNGIITAWSD